MGVQAAEEVNARTRSPARRTGMNMRRHPSLREPALPDSPILPPPPFNAGGPASPPVSPLCSPSATLNAEASPFGFPEGHEASQSPVQRTFVREFRVYEAIKVKGAVL